MALAPRQLTRPRAGEVGDANALEQVWALSLRGEAHVAGDREVWEQGVVLREVSDSSSLRGDVEVALGVEPDLVAERDPAGPWTLQAGHAAQQRRLPRTGWPDERDCLRFER